MVDYTVYEIKNVVTGRVYIGSTIDPRTRFQRHRRELRGNRHPNPALQNAWNKYGEDALVFKKVKSFDTELDMALYEENAIRTNIAELGAKSVYNIKVGVRSAPLHTPETKAKISEGVRKADTEMRGKRHHKVSEETRKKISSSLKGNTCAKGYKRTDTEKANIAKRMEGNLLWQGRNHSVESIDKMGVTAYAVDSQGNETKYPSINQMRISLGLPSLNHILTSIKSGLPLSIGSRAGWSFYTEKEDNRVEVPEEYIGIPRCRSEAKAKNSKYYFTGKPCKHGHRSIRLVKGTCVECLK